MANEEYKITLHWLNVSRAQAILWLFEELKVPYDLKIYHRLPSKIAPPDFEQLHPLGKSPLVTLTPSGSDAKPTVMVESGFIVSYFTDHFGAKDLIPTKWKPGKENKLLGETDMWLRYQHLLYYSEGTLMFWMVLILIVGEMKGPAVPFFIRPVTTLVANRLLSTFIFDNVVRNFKFLESLLDGSAPGGAGKFICGDKLTAADILISFPLVAAKGRVDDLGAWKEGTPRKTFPKLFEYIDRLEEQPGWKAAMEKVETVDGRAWAKM